jgi:hypothetical protein
VGGLLYLLWIPRFGWGGAAWPALSVLAAHDILLDQMVAVPNPDAPLKDSDTLLVAGKDEDLARAVRQK